ncbi:MAG: sulfotransferase [Ginsengibacter sp.]
MKIPRIDRKIFKRIARRSKHEFNERILHPYLVRNKQKIFCIGQNKTGTTSLLKTFQDLKFIAARETQSAKLLDSYLEKDYDRIINFCKSAQVFEDVPFSLPELYKHLDKAFPHSKFILTVRDNPEQWYGSLVSFLSKLFGKGSIPTIEDFKNARYIEKGWAWRLFKETYNTDESDLFNKEILIQKYIDHNNKVIEYFGNRENLLVINLAEQGSYQKFCHFIGVKSEKNSFPWVHKTATMQVR